MGDRQFQHLLIWNRLWLTLFILSAVGLAVDIGLRSFANRQTALSAVWLSDGSIRLRSASDGPFVVTNLACYGSNEGEKVVASLPEPIAILDSAGITLGKAAIVKLVWRDLHGQTVTAPKRGSDVTVMYFRPEKTVGN
jgi:hypothetical protein